MKTTLVLDKSVLQAAQGEFIEELGEKFDFLLPGTLRHESVTEELKERPELGALGEVKLKKIINANLRKAIDNAGNQFKEEGDAMQWEVEKGCSARYMPSEELGIKSVKQVLSDRRIVEECLKYDEHSEFLAKVRLPQKKESIWKHLANVNEKDFLAVIRQRPLT